MNAKPIATGSNSRREGTRQLERNPSGAAWLSKGSTSPRMQVGTLLFDRSCSAFLLESTMTKLMHSVSWDSCSIRWCPGKSPKA